MNLWKESKTRKKSLHANRTKKLHILLKQCRFPFFTKHIYYCISFKSF